MTIIPLIAEKRELTGRKAKRLRKEGLLAANVYGHNVDSLAIQVPLKEFQKVFAEAGETGLIELTIGGEKRAVLVHDIQYHPVEDALIHVDFHQVNLKEAVTANVPVTLEGESPAEKQGLGTVVQIVNEIEVSALPSDLPSEFVLDVSNLMEVDQQITLSDLKYDKNLITIDVEDPEQMVLVKVDALTEEEPEPVAEVAEEGTVEGEAPKEGEEDSSEKKKETPEA